MLTQANHQKKEIKMMFIIQAPYRTQMLKDSQDELHSE
jgi:hypothetical protein